MSAPKNPERFLLLLRDEDHNHPDAGPAVNRLKRALKVLLRSFGLRCDRAEIFPTPPPPGPLPESLGGGEPLADEQHSPDNHACNM